MNLCKVLQAGREYFTESFRFCRLFQSRKISYDNYPEFETPSPYKPLSKWRYGFKPKYFTGGLLPRVKEGDLKDKPLPIPPWKPWKCEAWTQKKALFGKNDYIDILGDGNIKPWELTNAPFWLRGLPETHEIRRIQERLRHEGNWLRDVQPEKYHRLTKRHWFLFKILNRKRMKSNFRKHLFSKDRFSVKPHTWDEEDF